MINLRDFEGIVDDERSGRGAYLLPRVLGAETPASDRLWIKRANPPQHGAASNRSQTLRSTSSVHLFVDIFGVYARLLEILLVDREPQNAFTLGIELNGTTAPATALVE
jgi:hypothetical protein